MGGFGCWLSSTDCNTHSNFEMLHPRCVAVVIDPIQSVKGKVVIDCFRLINPQAAMLNIEPRQTTANIGHINKPSIQALIHGLNRQYYSMVIDFRKNELEEKMLLNVHAKNWKSGLVPNNYEEHTCTNNDSLQHLLKLAKAYNDRVQEEEEKDKEQIMIENVGKMDPKRHLKETVDELLTSNIDNQLTTSLDTQIF